MKKVLVILIISITAIIICSCSSTANVEQTYDASTFESSDTTVQATETSVSEVSTIASSEVDTASSTSEAVVTTSEIITEPYADTTVTTYKEATTSSKTITEPYISSATEESADSYQAESSIDETEAYESDEEIPVGGELTYIIYNNEKYYNYGEAGQGKEFYAMTSGLSIQQKLEVIDNAKEELKSSYTDLVYLGNQIIYSQNIDVTTAADLTCNKRSISRRPYEIYYTGDSLLILLMFDEASEFYDSTLNPTCYGFIMTSEPAS